MDRFHIVMELMEGKDMSSYINKNETPDINIIR